MNLIYFKITHILLTGKQPGREASKYVTCELVGVLNSDGASENNLDFAFIWACISNPTTPSQVELALLELHLYKKIIIKNDNRYLSIF